MGFADFVAGLFRGLGSLAPPPKPPKPPTWAAVCAYCGAVLKMTGPPDPAIAYFCSRACEDGLATNAYPCAVCHQPAVDGELCMRCAEMWRFDEF